MREFATALLFLFPLLASCAGGASRYGCPAEPGYSCRSVSEVYAEAASGGGNAADFLRKAPERKNTAGTAGNGRRLPKGQAFRAGRDALERPGGKETPGAGAGTGKAMPVYVPPPAIRLWIAPWQDDRGVFHSEKYVYVLAGGGRWTIGGKTVPLGASGEEHPGNIRLRPAGSAP